MPGLKWIVAGSLWLAACSVVPSIPGRAPTDAMAVSADTVIRDVYWSAGVTAPAASTDIRIDSARVRESVGALQARAVLIEPLLDAGAVGLTADGFLALRRPDLTDAERLRIEDLVELDNADRVLLYQRIASGNGHPGWETAIREVFADRWIALAKPGWQVRSAAGDWTTK